MGTREIEPITKESNIFHIPYTNVIIVFVNSKFQFFIEGPKSRTIFCIGGNFTLSNIL